MGGLTARSARSSVPRTEWAFILAVIVAAGAGRRNRLAPRQRHLFSHSGDYQGQALTITSAAPLRAARALNSTVDVPPGVSGTFTAAPLKH